MSVGPRERLRAARRYSKVLGPVDDTPGVVDRVLRRGAAVARARASRGPARRRRSTTRADHGATTLEAYPVEVTGGRAAPVRERLPRHAVDVRAAGFEVVERRQANAASPVRPIVRLDALTPDVIRRAERLRRPSGLTPRPAGGLDSRPACRSPALV